MSIQDFVHYRTETFVPFRCIECGCKVVMRSAKDSMRTITVNGYQGIYFVPIDIEVPTCPGCGETYLNVYDSELLDAVCIAYQAGREKSACK